MEDIKKLLKDEIKYRKELLEKATTLIIRSEDRVNNINQMVGNLIEQNRIMNERLLECNNVVKREQDTTVHLLKVIEKKEERIAYLESILDKFFHSDRNTNQNNFNMK